MLFKDSSITNFGFGPTVTGAALHVASTGAATLNNAVFRHNERTVVSIEEGGKLSTTGCLRFIRVLTHKVHHSGLYSGMGTWSNSAGTCKDDMDIGNGDKVKDAYSPPAMDCGLPSGGTIEGTVVYKLNQDCACMNIVNIAEGAHVTINGNGHRIEGCSGTDAHFLIGNAHLTIKNAKIYGVRVRNYGGYFTLGNSILAQALKTPIINYGWAHLYDSVFEDNVGYGDGEGKVYYSRSTFHLGRAIFRDNLFRNNTPDEIEAFTKGGGTAIYLCGDNLLDGTVPTAAAAFFTAEEGGAILGCSDPVEPTPMPDAECLPDESDLPEDQMLGSAGIIMPKQKCPAEIEVWEVLPNSQGQFALEVSQSDVDAVPEGIVACSPNGRASVRVGLTEPVRQLIAHSSAYQAVSPATGARHCYLRWPGP